MPRATAIYALTSRDNPDRIMYVGQTRQDPWQRLSQHRNSRWCPRVRGWVDAIGSENIDIDILYWCEPDEDPHAVERDYIRRLQPPLNVAHTAPEQVPC